MAKAANGGESIENEIISVAKSQWRLKWRKWRK
jgi:hypothetical protein